MHSEQKKEKIMVVLSNICRKKGPKDKLLSFKKDLCIIPAVVKIVFEMETQK